MALETADPIHWDQPSPAQITQCKCLVKNVAAVSRDRIRTAERTRSRFDPTALPLHDAHFAVCSCGKQVKKSKTIKYSEITMQRGNNFLALFTWEDKSGEHMHLYTPSFANKSDTDGKSFKTTLFGFYV